MNRLILPANDTHSGDSELFNSSEDDYTSTSIVTDIDTSAIVADTAEARAGEMEAPTTETIAETKQSTLKTGVYDYLQQSTDSDASVQKGMATANNKKDDDHSYIIAQSTLPITGTGIQIANGGGDKHFVEPSSPDQQQYTGIFNFSDARNVLNPDERSYDVVQNQIASVATAKELEMLRKELAKSQLQVQMLTNELKREQTSDNEENTHKKSSPSVVEKNDWELKCHELETQLQTVNNNHAHMEEDYNNLVNDQLPYLADTVDSYHDSIVKLFEHLNGYMEHNKEFLTIKKNYKHLVMKKDIRQNFQQIIQFFSENLTTIREYKLEQQQIREEYLHDATHSDDDDSIIHQESVAQTLSPPKPVKEKVHQRKDEEGEEEEVEEESAINTKYEIYIEEMHSYYQEFFQSIMDMLEKSEKYEHVLQDKIDEQELVLGHLQSEISHERQDDFLNLENSLLSENSHLLKELNDASKFLKHQDTLFANQRLKFTNFQNFIANFCLNILNTFEKIFESQSINNAKLKLNMQKPNTSSLMSVLHFIDTGTTSLVEKYVDQLKSKNENVIYMENKELHKKWLLEKYQREIDLKKFEEKISNLSI